MIDLDEFIVPMKSDSIDVVNTILEKNKHYSGLGIHWYCFGSSGNVKRPTGNVLDNYLYRAEDNFKNNIAVKTIFNPRKVICVSNPHYPVYRHGYYGINENCHRTNWAIDFEISAKFIRINHYLCKSQEECKAKFARGKADIDEPYSWDTFNEYDRNDVFDTRARDLYHYLVEK